MLDLKSQCISVFDDVSSIGSADRGSNPLASTKSPLREAHPLNQAGLSPEASRGLLMGAFWNRRATESDTENQSRQKTVRVGGAWPKKQTKVTANDDYYYGEVALAA